MKAGDEMTRVLSIIAVSALAASVALAQGPGGGGGGRGRGGGGVTGRSSSPSAMTLSRPATPTAQPTADGFIKRWLVLEPISASGVIDSAVQAAVKKEYFPDQMTVIPHDGDKVNVNGAQLTWHAFDTKNFNFNLLHYANTVGVSANNALFWAVTVVNCPEEIKDARLAIGSNDASVWWVNGQEVIGIYGDRQSVIDDGVSQRLTLKKGPNVIRAAIHNQGGATDFCARFLDGNEEPMTQFTLSAGPAD
jgi:hypothetical protein